MEIRRSNASPCCPRTVLVSWVAESIRIYCALQILWVSGELHFDNLDLQAGLPSYDAWMLCAANRPCDYTNPIFLFFDGLHMQPPGIDLVNWVSSWRCKE